MCSFLYGHPSLKFKYTLDKRITNTKRLLRAFYFKSLTGQERCPAPSGSSSLPSVVLWSHVYTLSFRHTKVWSKGLRMRDNRSPGLSFLPRWRLQPNLRVQAHETVGGGASEVHKTHTTEKVNVRLAMPQVRTSISILPNPMMSSLRMIGKGSLRPGKTCDTHAL